MEGLRCIPLFDFSLVGFNHLVLIVLNLHPLGKRFLEWVFFLGFFGDCQLGELCYSAL
jgi:hypothetical protein